MKVSGSVSALLHHKGAQVWSVSPDATVFEAIQALAEHNIGALPVMTGDTLLGMFSERDYTRKVALKGKSSKETRVRDILSREIVPASPDASIAECMRLMTEHRIRHLPVLDQGKLVGIISIGDLVNWTISAQDATIRQMEQYIAGGYPG